MGPSAPLRVLIVGATGVFGRRLAEQLVHEPGITLILAGRTERTLAMLKSNLGNRADITVLDRDRVTPSDLRRLGVQIVVDAAGPFQNSRTALVEAAIKAGCHYADFADGRDFVSAIRRFDTTARQQNVAVLSGASSTPALSHAALDRLTGGWAEIDSVRVAICPGNRTPRGLSVVRGILSYTGQPVRVFRGGAWTTAPGWGRPRRLAFPGLGQRLASLCETPDLDLMVERYQPHESAEFFAGLESSLLHHGLRLCAMLVRWGLIGSLLPFARPMHFLASLIQPFGNDRGGMIAESTGRDKDGRATTARWILTAYDGRGPFVPTLTVMALIRRIRDGALDFRGAQPCVGILSLDDFQADFDRLGINSEIHYFAGASKSQQSWSSRPGRMNRRAGLKLLCPRGRRVPN